LISGLGGSVSAIRAQRGSDGTKQRWNQADDWIWSEQAVHEPLIDTTTFEKAQTLRRTRVAHAQHAPRPTPRPYLLRGLLYCGISTGGCRAAGTTTPRTTGACS
jgi:hypothetical protein